MFDSREFERVQRRLGLQFTLDGCCNDDGGNALCTQYACPSRSFFDRNIAGETLWCNAPFTQIVEFETHYRACKKASPHTTSAVFCAPQWEHLEKHFRQQGYQLVKTYPVGTHLFSAPAGAGRQKLPGIPWPVQLWWDPPAKELVCRAVVPQGGSYTMTFHTQIRDKLAITLIDSGADSLGAADGYTSLGVVEKLGFQPKPSSISTVKFADGRSVQLLGEVALPVRFAHANSACNSKPLNVMVRLLVFPHPVPNADILLGTDWLAKMKADLSWNTNTLTVRKGAKTHTLIPDYMAGQGHNGTDPVAVIEFVTNRLAQASTHMPLTATQTKRLLRHGARAYLTVVQPDKAGDSSVGEMPDTRRAVPKGKLAPRADMKPQEPTPLVPEDEVEAWKRDYADVFEELNQLPPHRPGIGHAIPLMAGAIPPAKRVYRLSPREQEEVKRQIADLLGKGFIEPSSSPFGAPVIFVEKKDGTLRMCMDYRALNKVTLKRRYPMPRIDELFDMLAGAKLFTSLDLQQGYYNIRITDEDKPKTAFLAPGLGQWQFKVLCFGLTNAPATFQSAMHEIFKEHIGKFVCVYLDDVLVYSKTAEEHAIHVRTVLDILRKHEFKAKMSKCDFNKPELKFLGHIVGRNGLKVDDSKVATVRDWPVPQNVSKLRSFLGLANYFRRFIQGYSTLVAPLTALTGDTRQWQWTPQCQAAFEGVKHALTNAPVLILPDTSKPYEIWSDASIYGTGAVLLQDGYAVAYTSRKFTPAETNYTTTEQECLGVIHALEEWRCYVDGAPVTLVTDHQPLTYLQDQARNNLHNRRQARWMETLSRFHFTWEYRPGRINVADPISRIWEPMVAMLTRARVSSDLLGRIKQGYAADPMFEPTARKQRKLVAKGLTYNRSVDLWYKGSRVVVPDTDGLRELLLHEYHNSPTAGHRGISRTSEAISRHYYWPRMDAEVRRHVQKCPSCQRNKPSNTKPAGAAQSLPIPRTCWESVSIDLITQLPKTPNGHDAILVIVDRLSKMTHFAPTTSDVNALQLARMLKEHVIRLHGTPQDLVSDRGTQFTSQFWSEVWKGLGTKLKMSTAYHPQTDGQTERMNRVLEETLRHYISPTQDDWEECLPMAEFAINSSRSDSTKHTPFYLCYGRHPSAPADVVLPRPQTPAAEEFLRSMHTNIAAARKALQAAQERQRAIANTKRSDITFALGEKVLLSSQNIKLKAPGAGKLLPRYLGPFVIKRKVGEVAYELDLPHTMARLHPVFHASLLKKWRDNGAYQPPPPDLFNGEEYFHVQSIIDHRERTYKNTVRRDFLVKWDGYGPEHNSWEPERLLRNDIPDTLDEYLTRKKLPQQPTKVPAPTRKAKAVKPAKVNT
jgi:transposase InsO family protein